LTHPRSSGDLSIGSANAKGDLQLTADGQVTLTGNGTALGRIVAYGSRIEVTAESTLASDDTIVLEAVQSLASRGILKAGNAVSIVSGGELIAEGSIASNGEIAFEGKSFRSTGLKISGSAVSVAGIDAAVLNGTEIVATKESVKVGGQQIELGQGTGFQAGGRIVIDAKDSLINGTVLDYANLDLSVRNRLTNTSSGQLVQDHLLLTIRDGLVNAGTLQGRVSTKIAADALTNTETGVIHGPDVILTLSNGMNNLGQVVSDRTLTIVAGDVVNKGNLRAGSELKLQSRSYRADSMAAILSAAKADLIVTGVFENSGQVVGLESLSLSALGAVGNDGAIETNGILDLDGASYRGGADSSLNAAIVNLGQRTG
jgi:filamentous hemagglutinin